jgi:hypothetical protein
MSAAAKLPALCPTCHRHARGFWEVEFDMDCADCRSEAARAKEEARLRVAVAFGKVPVSRLTKLGREVCGLNAQ